MRTVGSLWPYATTLFDYVRRAIPFDAPQSLSDAEVYAVSAYLLHLNGIVPADAVLDARSLPAVAMPNRALEILRDAGWIGLKPDANPVDVTELDVKANPSGIRIVPLEAAQAPRALDDIDFAAIQGNFAIFSGLKLTEALALEKMTAPYITVVAVRRSQAETPWAKAIVAAYRSDAFQAAIRADRFYDGFTLPNYFR